MKKIEKDFKGPEAELKKRVNMMIEDLGISQTEFITATGFNYQTGYRYIKNDTSVSAEFLISIAKVFRDYDMNWLLTGIGSMKKPEYNSYDFKGNVQEESALYVSENVKLKEKIISIQEDLVECLKEKSSILAKYGAASSKGHQN